jgi:hypothetical protein
MILYAYKLDQQEKTLQHEEFRGNTQNPEIHTIFISLAVHMEFLTLSLLPYV